MSALSAKPRPHSPEDDLAFMRSIVEGGGRPPLALAICYLAGGLLYGLQCLFHVGQAMGLIRWPDLATLAFVVGISVVFLLILTWASIVLQAMSKESLHFLDRDWSLVGLSGFFVYALGYTAEVLIVATLYWVLPVGRIQWRHAVMGGFFVASAWEGIRHVLVWYFTTLSKTCVVYGSFTTAVIALFCMEIIAALLLGAQVISEYERLEHV